MFKIAFPWARLDEERTEREYLKARDETSEDEIAGNVWISPILGKCTPVLSASECGPDIPQPWSLPESTRCTTGFAPCWTPQISCRAPRAQRNRLRRLLASIFRLLTLHLSFRLRHCAGVADPPPRARRSARHASLDKRKP